jgi:hypothetical protein
MIDIFVSSCQVLNHDCVAGRVVTLLVRGQCERRYTDAINDP